MSSRVRIFGSATFFCLISILLVAQMASAQAHFTISASPSSLSIAQGNQGTSTITTAVSGGFNNPITLSANTSYLGLAITFSFNPNPIPAPGSGTSTMTITVGGSVKIGTYPVIVSGVGGGIRQTTTILVTVTSSQQASFTITASPSSLTVTQGNQGNSTISTTVSNGFNSAISLSASGAPTNTTVSFSPNPIPAPGSGRSVMTIAVSSNTPAGTYPIIVTGNGGGIQQSATVTLTVTAATGTFTVSALPASLSLTPGSQQTAAITTAISGGFNGAISLSASTPPSGATITFAPSSFPAPGAGISTMTVTTGSSTPVGTYPITVTASNGTNQQTVVVPITVIAVTGEPFPASPRVYIDTTFNPPNGATWQVNSPSTLQFALDAASPGDTIILSNTVSYSGNFTLPAKTNPNNQWIYIESSGLSNLPPPGTRVNPSETANMATVTSPTVAAVFTLAPGANHYRLIGLEITTNSTEGGNRNNNPPSNNFTWCLVCWNPAIGLTEPDSITIDRSYLHGSPSQDVGQAIQANASNFAVIDSYISDIHLSTSDSQAILAYWTPGPIKIVDNYLSATTEDVLFGGAGGYNDPYVPSDIEIRRNQFYKPTGWDSCGVGGTVPPGGLLPNGTQCPSSPNNQWEEKNNLEVKSAQRMVVTGNTLQNTWVSAQTGSSVLFTVRTSQSGNLAVVDDILFQSNIMTNVDAGFGTLEEDDQCNAQDGYPQCTNPGESKRVWIDNNLLLLSPNADTTHHVGANIDGGNSTDVGLTDYIFQHNTVLKSDLSTLWNSFYFELAQLSWGCSPPEGYSSTNNVWVLDNALTQQPAGDCGFITTFGGVTGLAYYMGNPSPMAPRFYGNAMFVPSGYHLATWPGTSNDSTTTPFTYVNPGSGDYQLLIPDWTDTTDGKVSGIDWSEIQQAMNP
jgi:hypothetical protein